MVSTARYNSGEYIGLKYFDRNNWYNKRMKIIRLIDSWTYNNICYVQIDCKLFE